MCLKAVGDWKQRKYVRMKHHPSLPADADAAHLLCSKRLHQTCDCDEERHQSYTEAHPRFHHVISRRIIRPEPTEPLVLFAPQCKMVSRTQEKSRAPSETDTSGGKAKSDLPNQTAFLQPLSRSYHHHGRVRLVRVPERPQSLYRIRPEDCRSESRWWPKHHRTAASARPTPSRGRAARTASSAESRSALPHAVCLIDSAFFLQTMIISTETVRSAMKAGRNAKSASITA